MISPIIVGLIYGITWGVKIYKKRKSQESEKKKNDTVNKDMSNAFVFNTNKGDLILSNPFRGIYIQGGSGAGKSKSFMFPMIAQCAQKRYAGILYDLKDDLWGYAFHHYQSCENITPYLINFKDATRSIRVNPLNPDLMKKSAYAHEYAQTLMYNLSPASIKNESYFMMDAKSVLTGLIWYLKLEHPKFCTLPHIVSLILNNDITPILDVVAQNDETAGMVASVRQALKNDAAKQVAGVISTLQANLSKLNTPDLFWILSGNDIDLDINDPEDPKFISIVNESTLSQTYAPVISLIISVASKQMNQPNKHKSIIILDEAPTLYIKGFEEIPATARSNKVATVYSAQDIHQLYDKYGHEKAQVMISNLGNQFYGRVVNKNSAKVVSELFGKADKKYATVSRGNSYKSGLLMDHGNSSSNNISESFQERDRVKVTDVMNLQPGEFYGVIAEGNKKEILKAKFAGDHNTDVDYQFQLRTTERLNKENYHNIIAESRSILKIQNSGENTNLIQY
ncbi:type IV secretory system conjugative DNA transfer family protein [Aquimarina gracilis]|uniref:Type IV secretory system conjugative DNA transfer family protein n=1 Tax=Aquimarina gracilis TaxID=874422 RepID=A0ABU5ZQH9_9FLAO|nr:type IV secretory system conjugative DNA transfer family protein [Aquimarina gracilis]MEB3344330.1 type IV secretory system conjugative DNA transfer family protein [Aquimarina gracilis]